MYRPALRSAARPLLRSATRSTTRRWASTAAPADRPRTWRSSALRWGVAIGAVYYYNTAPAFMDSDALEARRTVEAPSSFDDADLPTVDSVLEEKRKQIQSKLDDVASPSPKETTSDNVSPTTAVEGAEGSPQALEDEAGAQGAFNPETGEINWDCPCLGGMASGPCGEEFKTAFSCFVYSDQEPKGMECIDKFQGMQECFRKYPEIYGAELSEEQDGEAPPAPAAEGFEQSDSDLVAKQNSAPAPDLTLSSPKEAETATPPVENKQESAKSDEKSNLPKWEDATAANKEVQD